MAVHEATEISEKPREGLRGVVVGKTIEITGRKQFAARRPDAVTLLPPESSGLECVVMIEGRYAGTYRFRDTPRREGALFIRHLRSRHRISRVMLLSGDRELEVRYLSELVGVRELHDEKSPKEKLAIVKAQTARNDTLFVGDGINDAPPSWPRPSASRSARTAMSPPKPPAR